MFLGVYKLDNIKLWVSLFVMKGIWTALGSRWNKRGLVIDMSSKMICLFCDFTYFLLIIFDNGKGEGESGPSSCEVGSY